MKRPPSPLPEILTAAATAALSLCLLLWARSVSAPPSALPRSISPSVRELPPPPPAEKENLLAASAPAPWPADETGPWMMLFRKEEAFPPVDLSLPGPTFPPPSSPPPVPGPRMEHSGILPPWGAYPSEASGP